VPSNNQLQQTSARRQAGARSLLNWVFGGHAAGKGVSSWNDHVVSFSRVEQS
jgi:hypothetical protein